MHALKSPFQEQFPVLDFSYTPLIIIASQTSRTSGWDLSVLRSFACTCVRALVFGLGLGLAGQPVLSSPAAAEELVAFTGYLPPLSINEQEKSIFGKSFNEKGKSSVGKGFNEKRKSSIGKDFSEKGKSFINENEMYEDTMKKYGNGSATRRHMWELFRKSTQVRRKLNWPRPHRSFV